MSVGWKKMSKKKNICNNIYRHPSVCMYLKVDIHEKPERERESTDFFGGVGICLCEFNGDAATDSPSPSSSSSSPRIFFE